jgi:hypothetical protein
VAFKHLLHNCRAVRLGGFRLWRFHFGGGIYTVGPMSTLRFVQYLEASGKLAPIVKASAPEGRAPLLPMAEMFRALVPLMVNEPMVRRHLEEATVAQIMAVLNAWQEVNDIDYMLRSVKPSADAKGQGFDRFTVNLAMAMHVPIHEVHKILDMPYQEVLAIVDAMRAEQLDLPAGAEPLDEDHRKELGELANKAGLEVN